MLSKSTASTTSMEHTPPDKPDAFCTIDSKITSPKLDRSQRVEGSDASSIEKELEPSEQSTVMHGIPLLLFTIGMMAIVFLMCLDHYILATAIPSITTDLNSLQDAAWYSSGYYLTNMALQPAFGQLYRLFSIRLIFLSCVVLFEAGSVLCALAPSSIILIIGRLITGVGGGGLYIGSVVLIGYAVPVGHRAMYISMVTSLDGVASFAGPLLGGVLTDSHLTWRFCFWINLPIGFVAFAILWWSLEDPLQQPSHLLKESVVEKLARVDWVSLTLLLSGFTMLLLAFQWAGIVYAWSDPKVCGLIVGGALTLALYFICQHYRGEDAAIPYRILRQRTVLFSCAFMLLINVLIGALVYYLPFQFQAVRGESAQMSGITNLAFLVPLLLSPLASGALISWTGWFAPIMQVGSIAATVGAALLTTLSSGTSNAQLIVYQLLAGFGGGFCHQIPYTSIIYPLPPADVVSGSALCSFLNSLGAIIGVVGSQAIFATVLRSRLEGLEGIDSQAVIVAGPANIIGSVPQNLVTTVRNAYREALEGTFYLPVAAAALCVICAAGVEWKRMKKGYSVEKT
ncbi:major facilitator superfamily domain-containing protein [Hypoxylon sp. NC1633]|nr:major facilitator superfamily domain-containing protein [Hypoxylon sp. NC1633]